MAETFGGLEDLEPGLRLGTNAGRALEKSISSVQRTAPAADLACWMAAVIRRTSERSDTAIAWHCSYAGREGVGDRWSDGSQKSEMHQINSINCHETTQQAMRGLDSCAFREP